MSDVVTVRGFVASEVKTILTEQGWPVASFRLGSTERRYDRTKSQWVDAGTNWYSVSMFRGLAQNASCSVVKGERVIVTGKLKLRQWVNGERRGIAPEIDAEAVGHDLFWGTAKFKRTTHTFELPSSKESPAEAGNQGTDGDLSEAESRDRPQGDLSDAEEEFGDEADAEAQTEAGAAEEETEPAF
ncbi:single-stranded DNA-binding protein [Psychromicrobium lacuslunae]|uniref:Single-stranded DNA-binding protein n=1 Tax=Psychromicrobium lacuslunae TaxID=1618207 RepID=A0A0D4BXI2_9MICC|nr:single-stranded DNA-binding protein [Psychromicrobium lacuslunae]AJT41162.1 hypothetical protein UM93_05890 [Psychromicrobium lacuslunae]